MGNNIEVNSLVVSYEMISQVKIGVHNVHFNKSRITTYYPRNIILSINIEEGAAICSESLCLLSIYESTKEYTCEKRAT